MDRVVRTLVPVSVRPRDDSGMAVGDGTLQNKVSAMFAELPVRIADAPARLHAVSRQMEGLKDSRQAVAGEALTSMTGFAPPMLLALGMRLATRMAQHKVNTVTTNVPGPQMPLYMAGRQMIKAFPYVPLAPRSASAWPSSPTTARSTSGSPATTTAPRTSTCCAGDRRGDPPDAQDGVMTGRPPPTGYWGIPDVPWALPPPLG